MQNINNFQVKCQNSVTDFGGLCDRTIEHAWPGSFYMRLNDYKKGDKINQCTFIEQRGFHYRPNGGRDRIALFECRCGNKFIAKIYRVRNGHTSSCGCVRTKRINEYNRSHGLSLHPLYKTWIATIQRCYNQKDSNYKHYGGRGICVCDEWRNDPKAYFDYVMSLPNAMCPGLSLDRIRNNEGYKPGNLRWADQHTQAVNQRIRSNNTSGYTGVYLYKNIGKWNARIFVRGKNINCGYFETKEEAAIARDQYIINNQLIEYSLNLK